jgi:hypothetical protein
MTSPVIGKMAATSQQLQYKYNADAILSILFNDLHCPIVNRLLNLLILSLPIIHIINTIRIWSNSTIRTFLLLLYNLLCNTIAYSVVWLYYSLTHNTTLRRMLSTYKLAQSLEPGPEAILQHPIPLSFLFCWICVYSCDDVFLMLIDAADIVFAMSGHRPEVQKNRPRVSEADHRYI